MRKGDNFQQNLLEKAYFIVKMSGPPTLESALRNLLVGVLI